MSTQNIFQFYPAQEILIKLDSKISVSFYHLYNCNFFLILGLSEKLIDKMFSICRCLNFRRTEADEDCKPDFIEWSILSGLCLLNNNILQTIAAPEIEQNTVNRLSVSIIMIGHTERTYRVSF